MWAIGHFEALRLGGESTKTWTSTSLAGSLMEHGRAPMPDQTTQSHCTDMPPTVGDWGVVTEAVCSTAKVAGPQARKSRALLANERHGEFGRRLLSFLCPDPFLRRVCSEQ